MLRGTAFAHADGLSDHKRHASLTAEHVADLGRLVDQLINRAHAEIGHTQISNWPCARDRGTHRSAHDRVFRDRRVDDALGTKFVNQTQILVGARPTVGG